MRTLEMPRLFQLIPEMGAMASEMMFADACGPGAPRETLATPSCDAAALAAS